MNEKFFEKYLVPFSVLVAGVIIGGAIYFSGQNPRPSASGSPRPTATPGPGQLPGPSDFSQISGQISVEGDPYLGDPSAKVTIIEFSDFQCPFCARFDKETFPQIKANYIDTGKVRLIYKNFPLPSHTFAQGAAEAAECALEQGKFWEYAQKLFANQSALDTASLKQYAKDLGLNEQSFNSCVDSKKYSSAVTVDANIGNSVGIRGTPSFIINGTLVDGAYPYSVFQAVIEAKLK